MPTLTEEPIAAEEPAHLLIVMDHTGDTKIIWDEDQAAEVDNARETFNRMKKQGYLAYSVDRKGDKGTVIKEFDPSAERLIMSKQTVGG